MNKPKGIANNLNKYFGNVRKPLYNQIGNVNCAETNAHNRIYQNTIFLRETKTNEIIINIKKIKKIQQY